MTTPENSSLVVACLCSDFRKAAFTLTLLSERCVGILRCILVGVVSSYSPKLMCTIADSCKTPVACVYAESSRSRL